MNTALSLIHGWGLTPAIWQPLAARLGTRYAVSLPTLPGHGDAPPARGVEAWLDALIAQLPDDGVVCGWSLGGQLALQVALRAPQKCRRLILVGTSPCFVQRADWPTALDTPTVDAFRAGFATDPAATTKRFVALQAMGDAQRRQVTRCLSAALSPVGPHNHSTLAEGLALLADTDLRPMLADITCPVRVLHGMSDALMPIAAAVAMAEALPDARFTAFEDCGHAPFIGRAADCATLIESFIDD